MASKGPDAPSPSSLIVLRGLTKTYHRGEEQVHALRGIDLQIERGEFVAVMGPSGSGKSTLMNLLGCLDRPTSGSYFLNGQDVAAMKKDDLAAVRLRTLGFVFQGFNLLARTSALENVELPLFYAGTRSKDRQKRALGALDRVGLADRAGHTPAQLSGGQQQRVAIARALVNEPRLLLADEPTGNLDSRTAIEVMELLQQLNQEGLTVLVVTHEPDVAVYAGRRLVVKDGRLLLDQRQTPRSAAADLAAWEPEKAEAGPEAAAPATSTSTKEAAP